MKYEIDNLKPDEVDSRDIIYTNSNLHDLPTKVDMRKFAGGIENQGRTGSCVANATVSALELLLTKGGRAEDLSRLFLYYNLRAPYKHLKEKDAGSYTRDGFKSVNQLGICNEDMWAFKAADVNVKPNDDCYIEAAGHRVSKYARIPGFTRTTVADNTAILLLKASIAAGYPAILGMKLGRTFYKISGSLAEQNYAGVQNDGIGGHAMAIVGYDDELQGFIVENSWDKKWGDNGFCLIKYDVLARDCHDVWTCSGFDGIELDPEWKDETPNVSVGEPNKLVTLYANDPKEFIFQLKATGTKPFTYEAGVIRNFKNSGSVVIDQNGLLSIRINDGANTLPIKYVVTGNGMFKKSAEGFITVKVLKENRPIPIEPEPQDEKKCNIICKVKQWFKRTWSSIKKVFKK